MKINRYFGLPKSAFCLTLLLTATIGFAQDAKPPVAPVREVTDTYFGQKVSDPYRWMEDLKADETQKWVKAQADFTRAYLDKLPMRSELEKRLNELSDTGVRVSGVRRIENRYFYLRRAPGENDNKLYVRDGFDGAERLLIDPEKLSEAGKRYSLSSWNPSFDGKLISYTISAGGSENGEMRVIEVDTGKDTGERIDRARFGAGAWLPDGKSFLYNRLQKLAAGAPPTDLYQKSRVYLHVLGANPEKDKPVFGFDSNPDIRFEQTLLPFAAVPDKDSKYVFAILTTGVSPNSAGYVAPIGSLNQAIVPWRKVADFGDEVASADIRGDDLYVLTYKNTPRYKIVRTSLNKPDMATATVVFPASDAVVTNMSLAKDALYVETRDAGNGRLYRVDYKDNKAQPVKLPYEGTAYIAAADQRTDGILYGVTSWTKSPAIYAYNPKTQSAIDTKLVPPIAIDMSSVEFVNVKAKSHDGAQVPLVIIYKKGLKRDGTNPTVMNGYGAYGIENTSPFFASNYLPWLELGGVIAVAGVRGGGEYGEEWHMAGFQKTKSNTWLDLIACAEYLIAEKYTAPAHLGIQGGSAGGILISNSITARPDLFGAAHIAVGLNNVLRAETTSNGVPNIPEFGTFKTEEGFKALLAMDGYSKVKTGAKYPAVILTHGINDPRVEPWMSAKMTARLQEATASGKPVLFRVDYDAGHGIGSTKTQRNAENADVMAFMFEQLK